MTPHKTNDVTFTASECGTLIGPGLTNWENKTKTKHERNPQQFS